MYPSLTDYIASIELAHETLSKFNYLRPILKPNGQPFFSSGNFAVVFKMEDTRTKNHMALKCFLRDVPERAQRLQLISDYIHANPSPYLVSMTYQASELWVDCKHCGCNEFDVVIMPWIEGHTLGEYLKELCEATDWRRNSLIGFVKRFDQMFEWLLKQPFAHGDLKPDNILVDECGNLKLIDYDGFFIPAFAGLLSFELGTPPYCDPRRTLTNYDENIDDFSLLLLSFELYVLVEQVSLS